MQVCTESSGGPPSFRALQFCGMWTHGPFKVLLLSVDKGEDVPGNLVEDFPEGLHMSYEEEDTCHIGAHLVEDFPEELHRFFVLG